jgi:hypothetical protein
MYPVFGGFGHDDNQPMVTEIQIGGWVSNNRRQKISSLTCGYRTSKL